MEIINIEKKKVINLDNERDLQRLVVRYLKTTDLLFCATLGGVLDTDKLRLDSNLDGYMPGIPDIMIYNKCGKYNGFALELKTPWATGKVSKKQKGWIDRLSTECNYFCLVSNDYAQIITMLTKYINGIL